MTELEQLRQIVRSSAGSNEVVLDTRGEPSVMVRVPKFTISEVIDGGSGDVHPAFVVDGREVEEIWISKYENCVRDGFALSVPAVAPTGDISFDEAIAACEAKGPGWHLMTNAEWAALALWCRKNGTLPHGNDDEGKDHRESIRHAVPAPGFGGRGRTLTGTGPLDWTHDGTAGGIWGLRGNICEMVGGLRTVRGEIQVIPDNDAAAGVSQARDCEAWRGILADGTLVAPGTSGTLRYVFDGHSGDGLGHGGPSFSGGAWTIGIDVDRQDDACRFCEFSDIEAAPEIALPELVVALALAPTAGAAHEGKAFLNGGADERIFNRGEAYNTSPGTAGMFYLSGNGDRGRRHPNIGFRSAYIANAAGQ
ncbi:MAG: hypothetical protein QM622_12205 [Microbacterium sp.]